MSKSPLRRNRRFERIALPVLLVLLVVVAGRQLRAATTSTHDRCDVRVERLVAIDGERHEIRHRHRGHRHDHDVEFDFDRDVDVRVDGKRIEVRIDS